MKCQKCEQEATFEIPEALCDRHWAEWFTEDLANNTQEKENLINETMKNIDEYKKLHDKGEDDASPARNPTV